MNNILLDDAFIANLLGRYLATVKQAYLGNFEIKVDDHREFISIYSDKRKRFENRLTRIALDRPDGNPFMRDRKDDCEAELNEFVVLALAELQA